MSISISILAHQLAAFQNEEYLALKDFKFYHKAWKKLGTLETQIQKSEKLILVISKWKIEQIIFVFVKPITYKKYNGKNTINLIFAI